MTDFERSLLIGTLEHFFVSLGVIDYTEEEQELSNEIETHDEVHETLEIVK